MKTPGTRQEQIRVRGTVQGVGFRPLVYRLAREHDLDGEVFNDANGVCIRIAGTRWQIEKFIARLSSDAPPLAKIDRIDRRRFEGLLNSGFRMIASARGSVHTAVAADASICADCLADTLDPANRRYLYPFTNCTHCGPRLSIVRAIPYDRQHTSMDAFRMCAACEREYLDPADRRFHAQPNACHACGPAIWLEGQVGEDFGRGERPEPDAVQQEISRLLLDGKVLAIKGIGGFHLACDASNEHAVTTLRDRKRRFEKPFALMARDLDAVSAYCEPNDAERELILSTASPIVIMTKTGPRVLADAVAPRQDTYGFMLPYTPLHHLVMRGLSAPIVLTSGNMSQEPQCVLNDDAREKLTGIADVLVMHDRRIINRMDDSVTRVIGGNPSVLRRARGYAPAPIRLPGGFENSPPLVAYGGELKNTFCLVKDGYAILSQHLGDLHNAAAFAAFRDAMQLFEGLFELSPESLAVDLHPEYASTKLGKDRMYAEGVSICEVQHHHAHIASCLADNQVPLDAPPVLGIALDGLGLGPDGTLWGGEFLLADYRGYRRVGTFEPVPMPGGTLAILEPWRMAYAFLQDHFDWEALTQRHAGLPFFDYVKSKPTHVLQAAIDKNVNCPTTSACGRLFDAVAAAAGLRYEVSYEAQGAIELEAILGNAEHASHKVRTMGGYSFEVDNQGPLPCIGTKPMWVELLADLDNELPIATVSRRFHEGLTEVILEMVSRIAENSDNNWRNRIALSGGVFQNKFLTERIVSRLAGSGYDVYTHRQVPSNDGGLSLGQAVVAAASALSN